MKRVSAVIPKWEEEIGERIRIYQNVSFAHIFLSSTYIIFFIQVASRSFSKEKKVEFYSLNLLSLVQKLAILQSWKRQMDFTYILHPKNFDLVAVLIELELDKGVLSTV